MNPFTLAGFQDELEKIASAPEGHSVDFVQHPQMMVAFREELEKISRVVGDLPSNFLSMGTEDRVKALADSWEERQSASPKEWKKYVTQHDDISVTASAPEGHSGSYVPFGHKHPDQSVDEWKQWHKDLAQQRGHSVDFVQHPKHGLMAQLTRGKGKTAASPEATVQDNPRIQDEKNNPDWRQKGKDPALQNQQPQSETPASKANAFFGLPLGQPRKRNTKEYDQGSTAAQSPDRSQNPIDAQSTANISQGGAQYPATGPGGV